MWCFLVLYLSCMVSGYASTALFITVLTAGIRFVSFNYYICAGYALIIEPF